MQGRLREKEAARVLLGAAARSRCLLRSDPVHTLLMLTTLEHNETVSNPQTSTRNLEARLAAAAYRRTLVPERHKKCTLTKCWNFALQVPPCCGGPRGPRCLLGPGPGPSEGSGSVIIGDCLGRCHCSYVELHSSPFLSQDVAGSQSCKKTKKPGIARDCWIGKEMASLRSTRGHGTATVAAQFRKDRAKALVLELMAERRGAEC